MWRPVIQSAKDNRLKNGGSSTPQMEQDAMRFVEFANSEVKNGNRQSRLSRAE
jgi:hypothetical protein